jgi:hypothetical protein
MNDEAHFMNDEYILIISDNISNLKQQSQFY